MRVLERAPSQSEPSIRVTVYQGIPKGDKMDAIVQKAVELGACGDRARGHAPVCFPPG